MKKIIDFLKNGPKIDRLLIILWRLFLFILVVTLINASVFVFQSKHNCIQAICDLIVDKHFTFLIVACFSLLTLYVAANQLKKQTDIASINSLIELRKLLTTERNREVHILLSPKDEQGTLSDWVSPSEDKNKISDYEIEKMTKDKG